MLIAGSDILPHLFDWALLLVKGAPCLDAPHVYLGTVRKHVTFAELP